MHHHLIPFYSDKHCFHLIALNQADNWLQTGLALSHTMNFISNNNSTEQGMLFFSSSQLPFLCLGLASFYDEYNLFSSASVKILEENDLTKTILLILEPSHRFTFTFQPCWERVRQLTWNKAHYRTLIAHHNPDVPVFKDKSESCPHTTSPAKAPTHPS